MENESDQFKPLDKGSQQRYQGGNTHNQSVQLEEPDHVDKEPVKNQQVHLNVINQAEPKVLIDSLKNIRAKVNEYEILLQASNKILDPKINPMLDGIQEYYEMKANDQEPNENMGKYQENLNLLTEILMLVNQHILLRSVSDAKQRLEQQQEQVNPVSEADAIMLRSLKADEQNIMQNLSNIRTLRNKIQSNNYQNFQNLLGELATKQVELTRQLEKVRGYMAEIRSLSDLKKSKEPENVQVANQNRQRDHDFMNAKIKENLEYVEQFLRRQLGHQDNVIDVNPVGQQNVEPVQNNVAPESPRQPGNRHSNQEYENPKSEMN